MNQKPHPHLESVVINKAVPASGSVHSHRGVVRLLHMLCNWWLIYVPALAILLAAYVISVVKGMPVSNLTRDPVTVLHGSIGVGAISQVGVIVWSTSAAVCLFSSVILAQRSASGERVAFLLASGLITLMLLLDDSFLFHENFANRFFGVGEHLVYAAYMLLVALYVYGFRHLILSTAYVPLALSFALFATSILLDVLDRPQDWIQLAEDGAKFLGIVTWSAYFGRVCNAEIVRLFARSQP